MDRERIAETEKMLALLSACMRSGRHYRLPVVLSEPPSLPHSPHLPVYTGRNQ
jgi:hypothetical protein